MQITVYNNDLEDAIRRFKKKYEATGIRRELKYHESFVNRAKLKRQIALRRFKKRLKERERREGWMRG